MDEQTRQALTELAQLIALLAVVPHSGASVAKRAQELEARLQARIAPSDQELQRTF
jgi:hypothetical protein